MRDRLERLLNRLKLTLHFFQATDDPNPIHKCEFQFIYIDGDRTAFGLMIYGLWDHETDQPDYLSTIPCSASGGAVMGSHQRRALVLGRRDARLMREKRKLDDILTLLGRDSDPCFLSMSAESIESLGREIVLPAYNAAYDAYPGFAPAAALKPWSRDDPTRNVGQTAMEWREAREFLLSLTDEELGRLAGNAAPDQLGAALKIALVTMTPEWMTAHARKGSQ